MDVRRQHVAVSNESSVLEHFASSMQCLSSTTGVAGSEMLLSGTLVLEQQISSWTYPLAPKQQKNLLHVQELAEEESFEQVVCMECSRQERFAQ